MNARRRIVHGTLAAALLATAGLAWAQAPTYTAPGHGSQAQLTDEQARQLDELREQYEEEMLALEIRLDAAERRLDAARRRPEVDTDQIIALRREMRDLEGQLEDLRLGADAEAARLLGHHPGATLDGSGQSRGHGRWRGWYGTCSWGACPWDGAWRGGDRATPWWGSSSWMGRRGSRAGWSRHCW
jgi:TolA-binding protein